MRGVICMPRINSAAEALQDQHQAPDRVELLTMHQVSLRPSITPSTFATQPRNPTVPSPHLNSTSRELPRQAHIDWSCIAPGLRLLGPMYTVSIVGINALTRQNRPSNYSVWFSNHTQIYALSITPGHSLDHTRLQWTDVCIRYCSTLWPAKTTHFDIRYVYGVVSRCRSWPAQTLVDLVINSSAQIRNSNVINS